MFSFITSSFDQISAFSYSIYSSFPRQLKFHQSFIHIAEHEFSCNTKRVCAIKLVKKNNKQELIFDNSSKPNS